ncbi:MAG: radical SAM protein [Lachnospiraceae bacterium]|nr:radical SAM protein [Lachnospiraceae bacterium]
MSLEDIDVFEDEIIEAEIDFDKVYELPENIVIVKYKEYYLAIYTEGVLWIVLENDIQKQVFEDIRKGCNIEYLMANYDGDDVINVIMQIEAKDFEHPKIIQNEDKNVYIYLTNNCNQRCRHCYMYAGDVVIEEVDAEKWINVLNKLRDEGCEGVTFTGGEITVYKGFEELIKHAHNIGLLVTVLSNGILWSRDMIDNLSSYIDEIQISIDGYDEESYYSVRKYNGFKKAIECIENFSRVNTKVSMAVTPLFEELDIFVDKFEPFAHDFLKKYPNVFIKLNHELIEGREVKTTDEQNREYRNKLKALVERLYPNYYTETFVLNYENRALRKNCGFGGITIAANGDVYWCNRIHELKSSLNVFECDMHDIFLIGKKIAESTSVDNTSGCNACEVRYICGGGCRMKYKGITSVETHSGNWDYRCEGKNHLYEKMILSNEYFFEE